MKRAAALAAALLSGCASVPLSQPDAPEVSSGVQTFRGRWVRDFEVSTFQGCWLTMRDAEPAAPPPADASGEIVFEGVRLGARNGPPRYGHLGGYPCLFRVIRLIDPRREQWPGPPPAGPSQAYSGLFRFGFATATFEGCRLSLRGTAWEAFERRHPDYLRAQWSGDILTFEIAFEGVRRTAGRFGYPGNHACEYEATRLIDSRQLSDTPSH